MCTRTSRGEVDLGSSVLTSAEVYDSTNVQSGMLSNCQDEEARIRQLRNTALGERLCLLGSRLLVSSAC